MVPKLYLLCLFVLIKFNVLSNFVLFTRLKAKATSAVLEQIYVSAKVFMKFLDTCKCKLIKMKNIV